MAAARGVRSVGRIALWALSWAVGIAAGVALGAYLTATSGVGAPGASELDREQLVTLPALAAAATFAVFFSARLVVSVIAGLFGSHKRDNGQGDHQDTQNDQVDSVN
jgi:uncharacterized membrane protein HdeD (DUF308 family)